MLGQGDWIEYLEEYYFRPTGIIKFGRLILHRRNVVAAFIYIYTHIYMCVYISQMSVENGI